MIRQSTSRVSQVLPADFAFSRPSTGYNSKGKLYMPNQLRLESSIYGGAVAPIEEATTNLIPVANQKFVGWYAYTGTTVTLTQNQSMPEWEAKDATRIQSSGGTNNAKYYWIIASPSVSGQAYTVTVYLKNIGAGSVLIATGLGNSTTIASGESKLVKISVIGNGTYNMNMVFSTANVSDSLDIIAWHPQVESKACPTSFIETSRAAESLTIPTTGLNVSGGTIEGIFEVTDVAKRQTGNNRVIRIPGTSGQIVFYHSVSTHWNFYISNGTTESYNALADSLIPNGWYYYKAYWDSSSIVFDIWSLSTKTKVGSVSVTVSYLPAAFGSYIYLGSNDGSSLFANTRFGRHRLSSIVRTDDPDFNNLMPQDSNTVALMDFDDIGYRANQCMVV
jgi:hypothetical protein